MNPPYTPSNPGEPNNAVESNAVLAHEPSFRKLTPVLGKICPLFIFTLRERAVHIAVVLLGVMLFALWYGRSPELRAALDRPVPAVVITNLPPAGSARQPAPLASLAPPQWADFLTRWQALVGVATLAIACLVWLGELREDWESQLPKRMSVYFFSNGKPVIICRNIWLAGADDLRNWGQQVAAQAAHERFLDFNPDVAARTPEIVRAPDGTVCKHYSVRFHLTKLPDNWSFGLDKCRYQNLFANVKEVRSEAIESVKKLPDVAAWQME
jgi:hypothetical protein